MELNSYLFVLIYLPLVLGGYFFVNKHSYKYGKTFLILMSAVFYIPAGLQCLIVLCASILINYLTAYLITKKGWNNLFVFGIALNVVFLLYCKYLNFFIENIDGWFNLDIPTRKMLLPVGISFYTFQQIMFLVETKKENKCCSLRDYCLYILYFPKILMGPLTEPADFIKQINDNDKKKVNYDNIVNGVRCFVFGVFKKVIIADTFASAVNWGYTNISECTSVDMLIVVLSYTMQIYFDFSGYSDMARGVSFMLNIDLPVNFNSPYKAVSIKDFWDRWHISLTKFLTKYIYIPLGGNRKGEFRTYINIIAVFLISGIWHGSNWTFLLWGGLYGIFMCIERRFDSLIQRIPKIITWAVTFAVVNFMWIFFWTDSLEQTGIVFSRIIHFSGFGISSELEKCFCMKEFYFLSYILKMDFINAHLWSLSMVLMIGGAVSICMLLRNMNGLREKVRTTYTNLVFLIIISVYCILSLGYGTTEFIYKGF